MGAAEGVAQAGGQAGEAEGPGVEAAGAIGRGGSSPGGVSRGGVKKGGPIQAWQGQETRLPRRACDRVVSHT